MLENVSQVEQGLHGSSNTSQDIREVNAQDDGKQSRLLPLGLALTGYRLFTTSWILGLGIPKAVYSNRGQSLVSPTLDWVGGIILSLLSFWLGVVETSRPELCPRFFEVDLAPFILKFLRRDDVYHWLASVLPLLLAVEALSFVEPTKRTKFATSEQFIKDGPTQIFLGASLTVFRFCLYGLKVLWPKGFKGNGRYAFLIVKVMMVVHMLFLSVKLFRTNSNDPIIAKVMYWMTIFPYMWMIPWDEVRLSELCHSEGSFSRYSHYLRHITQYVDVILFVGPVILGMVMFTWGLPEFPKTRYSLLFLCCALVYYWRGFSAFVPPSWVTWATSSWATVYGGVRSSGTKAKDYVLDVYHRF